MPLPAHRFERSATVGCEHRATGNTPNGTKGHDVQRDAKRKQRILVYSSRV